MGELARKSKRLADGNRTGREPGANSALIRGDRLSPMAAGLTLIVQQPSRPPLAAGAAGHISRAALPLVQAAALGAKADAGCTRRLGPILSAHKPLPPGASPRQAWALSSGFVRTEPRRFPHDSCGLFSDSSSCGAINGPKWQKIGLRGRSLSEPLTKRPSDRGAGEDIAPHPPAAVVGRISAAAGQISCIVRPPTIVTG
jgi:hypothetical protein